jgi:hypothetical protein
MYNDLISEKTNYSLDFPKTIVPTPSDTDYENGFIERYFTQKVNDKNSYVFEIDKEVYFNLFENPYWAVEIMKWRITGPISPVYNIDGILTDKGVIESNNASISIISEKIKNVKLYLPNILQFHK